MAAACRVVKYHSHYSPHQSPTKIKNTSVILKLFIYDRFFTQSLLCSLTSFTILFHIHLFSKIIIGSTCDEPSGKTGGKRKIIRLMINNNVNLKIYSPLNKQIG